MTLAIKIWFCLAVATIAAAITDPLVEFASETGWFGPGDFTDHSHWIVVPAFLVGVLFVGFHFYLRIRRLLVGELAAKPNWLRLANKTLGSKVRHLVPAIFVGQILALYLAETLEQFVAYGHVLGGTVWLGGPTLVTLMVHAITCCATTLVVAWVLGKLALATVHLVKLVRGFQTLSQREPRPLFFGWPYFRAQGRSMRVLCRIAERAPPLLPA